MPWEQSAASSGASGFLAEHGLLANACGAEVLDEQNSNLDRSAFFPSFTLYIHASRSFMLCHFCMRLTPSACLYCLQASWMTAWQHQPQH